MYYSTNNKLISYNGIFNMNNTFQILSDYYDWTLREICTQIRILHYSDLFI